MIKRCMISCGAIAKIYTALLRRFGIPVKMVHGRIRGQRGESRHAWLKLYDPHKKRWFALDTGQKGFKLVHGARQLKIYSTWEGLYKDYKQGKW